MLNRFLFAILGVCLLSCRAYAQPNSVQLIERGYIFDTASFRACHASTIVALKKNALMAAWFGGAHEGSPDVCIWGALKNTRGWSAPMKIADGIQADGKQLACWNPVLFLAKDGRLYLHYKVGPSPREWWAMYKWSADQGKTWSAAKRLPDGFLGPIKNKPLQLADGNILYPSSEESMDEKHWTIHLERSDPLLKKWERIEIDCDTFQTIQPSILTYPVNRLQLLARSKQNTIVQSWSADNGQHWSRVTRTSLPNPNSGSDAVSVKGLQVLVYNPLPAGKEWWEGRSVLKVALSTDGEHWKDVYTLENETKGEFSYPAIIADRAGNIHITYTGDRKRISYVALRLTKQ